MARESNIFDYLHVLVKWRKLIVLNFLAVSLLAAGISLILPKWYTATTTILPPEEQTSGIGLPSMLANLPLGGLGIPGVTTPAAIYVAILESRTVREGVIKNLDLMEIYKSKNIEEAVRTLGERTDIEISEEGVVQLKATARTPQRAADIANAHIEELDRKNTELNVAQARNNRIFIEERLAKNRGALEKAEEDLRQFQEKYKAISLPEQTAAAIEAAATVIGEMRTLEVKRDVMLATMKPTNPNVIQIQTQIDALQKQLDRMEFGYGEGLEGSASEETHNQREIYVPFSEVPTVGLELARLTRELKIQEVIFELLTQQYEQAKIQEAKDTPTVQVLDSAVPPERRSRPKRKAIVIVAGIFSLFVSTFCAFLKEYLDRLNRTKSADYQTLKSVSQAIKNDFYKLKKSTLGRSVKNVKR
ncbi:MAG: GumC family protein [bacterium]